jgi:hypothetical protein
MQAINEAAAQCRAKPWYGDEPTIDKFLYASAQSRWRLKLYEKLGISVARLDYTAPRYSLPLVTCILGHGDGLIVLRTTAFRWGGKKIIAALHTLHTLHSQKQCNIPLSQYYFQIQTRYLKITSQRAMGTQILKVIT